MQGWFEAVDGAPEPSSAFSRVAHLPWSFWLDSASAPQSMGRYSFVGAHPYGILETRGAITTWRSADGTAIPVDDPFDWLDETLEAGRLAGPAPVPLAGGAVGWISYEMADHFERLPPRRPAEHGAPDLQLAFFDTLAAWDHEEGKCWIVSTGHPATGDARRSRAVERAAETRAWLREAAECVGHGRPPAPATTRDDFQWPPSTHTPSEYAAAVRSVVDAIVRGDVYQVNLSQRFRAPCHADPAPLYHALRSRSPAPYGACLRSGETTVLSSSPERFLRVTRDGAIEARPIKGTRRRATDPEADAVLARELEASPKDRAENLMIVDLMRNDLSRICLPGSISVPDLFRLESWATVHHLVSTIRGRLAPGVSAGRVLAATFPCGSVTGAPRIRAMELIARYETVPRGPYCGAIGYFSFDGNVDLSVGIRIMTVDPEAAWFHAGGGIVADSDPSAEYEETLDKARALAEALGAACHA